MRSKDEVILMMKNQAGSRFHCARRLKEKDKINNAIIFVASAFAVILGISGKYIVISLTIQNVLDFSSICLSILIISISAIQYGSTYSVDSRSIKQCAEEISAIRRNFESKNSTKEADIIKSLNEMNKIIEKTEQNHEEIDFLSYKLERWENFSDLNHLKENHNGEKISINRELWNKAKIRFKISIKKYGFYIAIIILLISVYYTLS